MAPIELLQRVPLFSDLDRKELESLARTFKERNVSSGDTVVSEDSGAAGFFVIEDGTAKVTVHGQERGTLGPGRLLRRDRADRRRRTNGDDHRRQRHAAVRAHLLGVPAARGAEREHRVEAPPGARARSCARPSRAARRARRARARATRRARRDPRRANSGRPLSARISAARQRLVDAAAEDDAAGAELGADRSDLARAPCPPGVLRSTVPSPVTTRSAPARPLAEADQLEHELGARHELARRARRASRRARRPRPRPACPRPAQLRHRLRAAPRAPRRPPGVAPFCGPNARAAPRSPSSGFATSQARDDPLRAERVPDHARAARHRRRRSPRRRGRRAAPPAASRSAPRASARRARGSRRAADRARRARAARARSPRPPRRPPGRSGAAGNAPTRAARAGRRRAPSRHSPPSTAASTSSVPSPPSATGSSSTSTPVDPAQPGRERGRPPRPRSGRP